MARRITRKKPTLQKTILRGSDQVNIARFGGTGRTVDLTAGWYVDSATATTVVIKNDDISSIAIGTYNGISGSPSVNQITFSNPDFSNATIIILADGDLYELPSSILLAPLQTSQTQATIDSINVNFEINGFKSIKSLEKYSNAGQQADRLAISDSGSFFNSWGQHDTDWALEFWARTDRDGGTSNAGIFRFGNSSNDNYWTIADGQSTDQLLFRFYTDNGGASGTSVRGQISLYDPSTVDADTVSKYMPNDKSWHHFVIRYWGSTLQQYGGTPRTAGDMRLFTVWIDGVLCQPPETSTGYGNGIRITTNGTTALQNGWNDTPAAQPVDFLSGYDLVNESGKVFGFQNIILWSGTLSNSNSAGRFAASVEDPLGINIGISKAIMPFNGYQWEVAGTLGSNQPQFFNEDNTLRYSSSTEQES